MKIVNENVKDQLTARNLRRFNHPEEDKKKLNEFIIKKKSELLYKIATDLIGLWSIIEDDDNPELSKALLKLVILDCPLSDEQLDAIYNIDPVKTEIDHQLKEALATLAIPEEHRQPTYEAIFKFRHMYFLDKPFSVRPNPLAFPERLSERALNGHYNRIALYFKQEHRQTLPKEEQQLLDLFYPEVQLRKKIVRREANLDITVEPNTIQSFIYNAFKRVFDQPSSAPIQYPLDNFDMSQPLPPQLQQQQDAYTNEPLFKLLDQPEALRTTLAKDKSAINQINYHDRRTLLMEAVLRQDETLVKLLIDAGADVNLNDCTGYTALHLAAEGKNQTIFDLILAKANAKTINFADQGDYTPMYIAAEAGHVNYVKALLERGADPNLQDKKWGNTVLHIAVRNNQTEVVAELLRHPKTDRSIQDKSKEKKTAEDLIKNEARLKPLAELFSQYPDNKRTAKSTLANPSGFKSSSGIENIRENIQSALLNPDKSQNLLKKMVNRKNIFLDFAHHILPAPVQKREKRSFAEALDYEKQTTEIVTKFYEDISRELKEIRDNSELSDIQSYYRVYNIRKRAKKANMSATAFAFELVRLNMLPYLSKLQSNVKVMQMAIDAGDLGAIKEIYIQEPDREKEIIVSDGQTFSELQYAIFKKKTLVVRFIVAEQQADRIKMEQVDNAIGMTERVYSHVAQARQDIIRNLPASTLSNWQALLKNLQTKLPENVPNISGLFTQEESELVATILNKDKECVTKYIVSPENQLDYIQNKIKDFEQARRKSIDNQNEKDQPAEPTIFIREFSFYTDNIYKITQEDNLLSSDIEFLITPTSTSPSVNQNPKTHMTKVYLSDAINKKILSGSDLFFSGIPSNKTEWTQTPIKFIGDDPNIATIFTVYCKKTLSGKYLKYYRFDYFENDQPKFSPKIHQVDPEYLLFDADSDKYFTYLLIFILQGIKGEFSSGSYYHYLIKNRHNSHIIDNAKDVIFSKLSINGNISKDLKLDNKVVSISKNPAANLFEPLDANVMTDIEDSIMYDNQEKLKTIIRSQNIYNKQLSFALIIAIKNFKVDIVKFLLEISVTIDSSIHDSLSEVVRELGEFAAHDLYDKHPNYQASIEILRLITSYGSKDENNPEHIHHLGHLDTYVSTSKKSSIDIKLLILQVFENTKIADCYIDGLYSELDELYRSSFYAGLFNIHLKIAKRLNKEPAFPHPTVSALFRTVDENDLVKFEQIIKEITQADPKILGPLFFYALKAGNNQAVDIALNYLKNDAAIMTPAILVALKYNAKSFILKAITDIGIKLPDIPAPFMKMLLNYTITNFDAEKNSCFLKRFTDLSGVLISALIYKNLALATTMLTNPNFSFDHKTIDKILVSAANSKDMPIFKLTLSTMLRLSSDEIMLPIANFLDTIVSGKNSDVLTFTLRELSERQLDTKFSIFIIEEGPPPFTLKKSMRGNFIDTYFKKISPECLRVLLDFMKKTKPKGYKKRRTVSQSNYLHVALTSNHPENISIMQAAFPDLSLISTRNTLELFEFIITNCSNNKTIMLDAILSREISFPASLKDRVYLLSLAIFSNQTNVIAWFFEKQFLKKDELEKDSHKNILQLVFDHSPNHLHCSNTSLITSGLLFLVKRIGVDLNHRDSKNQTFLSYPLYPYFIDFALKSNPDWTVKDSEMNTPLHTPHILTTELIDTFYNNGGNIKALNSDLMSILERFVIHYRKENTEHVKDERNSTVAIKNKLIRLGCQLRSAFLAKKLNHFLITCTYDNKLYVLTSSQNCFLFDNSILTSPVQSYNQRHISDGTKPFSIFSFHKAANSSSLPIIKKLPLKYPDEFQWIPVPNFSDDEKSDGFQFNSFAKLLLTYFLEIPENISTKLISVDKLTELNREYKNELEKIASVYNPVLSGNLQNVQAKITLMSSVTTQQIYHIFPSIYLLCKNEANMPIYQHLACLSPLTAAVVLKHQDILDYLLSKGFHTWAGNSDNPIHMAICNNPSALRSLLNATKQTFKKLNSYTSFLSQDDPKNTCHILEVLSQQALLLHKIIINKNEIKPKQLFVTFLDTFVTTTRTLHSEIDLTTLTANLNDLKAPAKPDVGKLSKQKRKQKETTETVVQFKTRRKADEKEKKDTKRASSKSNKRKESTDDSSEDTPVVTLKRSAQKPTTLFFKRKPVDPTEPVDDQELKKHRSDEDGNKAASTTSHSSS